MALIYIKNQNEFKSKGDDEVTYGKPINELLPTLPPSIA